MTNQPKQTSQPEQSELGKAATYDSHYNPERLYPIPRAPKREEIGVDPNALPFVGFDCWNHYEVSWLNQKGKPMVAVAEIYYDCTSPFIIESKSLKLYFNSLNNTPFESREVVQQTIQKDLEKALETTVRVLLYPVTSRVLTQLQPTFTGESLDELDVACSVYMVEPSFLSTADGLVEEVLCSDLLKSNCLVTGQPDWGSVQIEYRGKRINREGLLKYLVSFRNHNEFHEQCIERIFVDIMAHCQPEKLTVYGRYTRRGGIDINPYRSTEIADSIGLNQRLLRQ